MIETLFITLFILLLLLTFYILKLFIENKKQKIRYKSILDSQNNIVLVTTGSQIKAVNQTFLDFFGYQSLEEFKLKYHCICDHFIPEDGYLAKVNNGYSWEQYILLNPDISHLAKINIDNKEYIFKIFVNKIEKIYSLDEIVVTLVDHTKEIKTELELIKQKNIAIEANNIKNQFLANISHELKTPMNAIINLSTLSLETKLDENQYNLLSSINGSAKLLLSIIDDILDITQIEKNELSIENKAFNLIELRDDLNNIFFTHSIKQDLKLIFKFDNDLPKVIVSDKIRLLQVLSNFLSNAFKFTNKGEIKLSVNLLEKADPKKAKIRFSVKDSGIGIDDKNKQQIFEAFTQADSSHNRKYSGSGLGLAISNNIIKQLGTNIELISTLDKGSEFSFVLDLDVFDWDNDLYFSQSSSTTSSYPILDDLNILLVEDNEINQKVAAIILEKSKINVDLAQNGKEAVEIFKANQDKYDLILMDLQMPVLSGYEATIQIREFNKTIPIIALTAASLTENRQKVIDAGMNDHLSKPIDKELLFDTIIKYTNKSKENIDYIQIETSLTNNTLNLQTLEENLANKELATKLLKTFLSQLNGEFSNIIEELLANSKEARFLVHGLKGISGNLGANKLFMICQKIDEKFKNNHFVSPESINALAKELDNVKQELNHIIKEQDVIIDEDITKLSQKELDKLIDSFISNLQSGDLLSQEDQNLLYTNLEKYNLLLAYELEKLKESIEEFEYHIALEILSNLKKD
ncbi:MAG: response regulator [Arcobacteraceae bacterium]